MHDLVLLQDFITEAGEHLEELETELLHLEADPDDPECLNGIFRSVHSIKGAAQYVGLERISDLSHRMETLLDLIRNHEKVLTPEIVDVLMASKDRIAELTQELADTQAEQSPIDALCRRLDGFIDSGEKAPAPTATADTPHLASLREMLQDEAYTDEQDAELLVIFTEQLKDQLSVLAPVPADGSPATEKTRFLRSAAPALEALRSAANYMGYDRLIAFYDRWREAVDKALSGAEDGSDPAVDFFPDYLCVLGECFPQLDVPLQRAPAPSPGATAAPANRDPAPMDVPTAPGEDVAKILDDLSDPDDDVASDGNDIEAAMDQLTETEDAPADDDLTRVLDELEPPAAPPEPSEDDTVTTSDRPETSAAADAPVTAPETPATAPPSPDGDDDEVFREDVDGELFDIFLKHAIDGIGALQEERQRWSEDGCTHEGVTQSVNILKSLQSSANYMGYDTLQALYLEWASEALATGSRIASGEPVSLDFWDDYMSRVLHKLPKVADRLQSASAVSHRAENETAADSDDGGDEVAVAEAPRVDDPDPTLFDMLNDAFNATLSGAPDDSQASLVEVIKEIMEGDGEVTVPHFMAPENDLAPQAPDPSEPAAATAVPHAEPGPAVEDSGKTVTEEEPAAIAPKPAKPTEPPPDEKVSKREAPNGKKFKQSFRIDADKIDYLMNQVGELVVSRAFFSQLYNDLRGLHQSLKENLGLSQKDLKPVREFSFRLGEATVALGRVSNELQEGVMKARMLPISQLFSRYPRLARDLVHKSDKQVKLETRGEDTELDKMIIEAISDPLIHIIRNAVDHGIETVEERRRAGKPDVGSLVLEAYHESNHIVIEVTDDGRGIDLNRIRKKAVEGGFGTEEDVKRLSDRELMRLIMMPGFSTADHATRTSGRGVGMDVVRKNIEKLNGSIEIESTPGIQTCMRVKIPLTLAIITALLVRVGKELFTIPLSAVDETIRVYESDMTTIDCVEVIHLREKTTPILRLSEIFGLSTDRRADGKHFIVIVKAGSQHVGLVVDTLIGQEEVVIKPLPDYLRGKSGFSGATIIGDGGISLILDIYELVNLATRQQIHRRRRTASAAAASGTGDISGMDHGTADAPRADRSRGIARTPDRQGV